MMVRLTIVIVYSSSTVGFVWGVQASSRFLGYQMNTKLGVTLPIMMAIYIVKAEGPSTLRP